MAWDTLSNTVGLVWLSTSPWPACTTILLSLTTLAALLLLLLIIVLTYLTTLLRAIPAIPNTNHEPPIAPYCLPYLQHLPAFLLDPVGLVQRIQARHFPSGAPFTLRMTNTKFHVFNSPAAVAAVFTRSRQFAFEPVLASMMENGMDLPIQDRWLFYLPTAADARGRQKDSAAFLAANHRIWLTYLSGDWLGRVMRVYAAHLDTVLDGHVQRWRAEHSAGAWFQMDYHEWVQRIIFDVSAQTFFGPRLAACWGPGMWEDWKRFNKATYVGVRAGLVYKLDWRAGQARERMVRAFERWVSEGAWQEEDSRWPIWDGEWGYVMNRERERLAHRCGFSLRGRACLHASFLFVIVTNSAPMATWFSFLASNTPARLAQFRQLASLCLLDSPSSPTSHPQFDRAALQTHPFLQGLWREALRLGSASAAARVVMQDTTLDGYLVRKGSVILLPVALLHHDSTTFPDPSSIKPERWILDPEKDPSEERARLQRQTAALRSFGGGTGLCSGRHVAEEEVLTLVGRILAVCDVRWEGVGEGDSWRGYEFDTRSIGIMGPRAGRMMVRMRVRARDKTD